jgi:phosphoglycerol transferase MdoB-like AlkP superfamily enzyme
MRAAGLLCVLILAKLCMTVGQSVPVSAWTPVAYLWQDLLVVLLFAGIDGLVRRSWVAWTAYGLIVAYVAVNVPVARVLGTPLTAPMLRATRGTLAESVAHHATPVNVGLLLLVLASAATCPLLFRRARGRHLAWGAAIAAPVILLGPFATARVDTGGLHRNPLVAIVTTQFPHLDTEDATEQLPTPADVSGPEPDRGLAQLRGAAAGRNVVLVMLESAAAQYLRPYGAAEDPMPNVTALAVQGILFDRAYAVYPESIRGLFAVLCSRYPAIDTEPEMYERVTTPSLAAVLRGHGYQTALFHSGRFRYLGMQSVVRGRGFQALEDAGQIGGDRDSSFGIDEPSVVRRLLGWIDGLPRGERFFATYVPIAGHHPYDTPEPGPFPERRDIDRYRNALHYADAAVGQLVDGLRARGLERQTVVVLVGDHGQAFGQHQGNFGHTLRIYEENVWVPLVISAPGVIPRPMRVPGLASHVDITPTVLDLLGLAPDVGHQGLSLLRSERQKVYFFADASLGLVGLRDGRWKYIHETDSGRSRLFDLDADPGELTNLADGQPDLTDRYKREVVAWARAQRGLIIAGR